MSVKIKYGCLAGGVYLLQRDFIALATVDCYSHFFLEEQELFVFNFFSTFFYFFFSFQNPRHSRLAIISDNVVQKRSSVIP